jgi:hypothetical protein
MPPRKRCRPDQPRKPAADEELAFLPRDFNGRTRQMTLAQVCTSARSWCRLSRARAEQERYAVVEAEGRCRMAIEITQPTWPHTARSRGRPR